MSAYKKFNRQDVFVTDYVAKKQWEASGNLVTDYSINTIRGFKGETPGFPYPKDYRNNQYESLVYKSVDHNYYADSLGNGTYSGSRDLSLQTSLTEDGARNISTEVAVISLPKDVYGTHIEPNTFVLKPLIEDRDKFVDDGYAKDPMNGSNSYVENVGNWYDSDKEIDLEDYFEDETNIIDDDYVDIDRNQQRLEIVDDGNGHLIYSGSNYLFTKPKEVVGDIIYNQGLAIITNPVTARYFSTYSRHKLRWKSNQPIYTYNAYCRIKDSEMNFTYNPSAVTGSNGQLTANALHSSFNPYITTIGLYNDSNELIAVAKTNRPIVKSKNADTTFVVKIDV